MTLGNNTSVIKIKLYYLMLSVPCIEINVSTKHLGLLLAQRIPLYKFMKKWCSHCADSGILEHVVPGVKASLSFRFLSTSLTIWWTNCTSVVNDSISISNEHGKVVQKHLVMKCFVYRCSYCMDIRKIK